MGIYTDETLRRYRTIFIAYTDAHGDNRSLAGEGRDGFSRAHREEWVHQL